MSYDQGPVGSQRFGRIVAVVLVLILLAGIIWLLGFMPSGGE